MTQQRLPQFKNPRRVLSHLLQDLASREIEHRRKQIKQAIMSKKQKIKSMYQSSSHQIIQPPIKATKLSYDVFHHSMPINKDEPFISQKIKASALTPERFYTHEPNIKAGSFSQGKKWSVALDSRVVNGQFEEYNRLVDEQSGFVKRAKIAQLLAGYSTQPMKKKYSRMKKTYFQKFMPDKYNFYQSNTQKSINLESTSILKKSRSRVYDTHDTNHLTEIRRDSLPSVGRQEGTIPISMQGIVSHRSRDRSRENMASMGQRKRLKTVVFQKNLDSLN